MIERAEPELRRSLGLVSAVTIVVGGVIGSGIFLKPLDISRSLPSPAWIYGIWAVLGAVCLFGAFAYAELGTMFPEAGGQYAFLREAYGKFTAFLYGWCFLFVINSGTIAALAVAFGGSLARVVPMSAEAEVVAAAAMILALAIVNHFGVRFGAALQNVATFAKLGALGAIALGGFLFAHPSSSTRATADPSFVRPDLVTGLVASAIAIFWAYEGWYQLPFSAAELKRPERDLPRGLIVGVLILVAVYVGVNAVYLHVVPIDEMRSLHAEIDVPRLTIERTFGVERDDGIEARVVLRHPLQQQRQQLAAADLAGADRRSEPGCRL
ncbi:MAG: amino acid permease, partial [Planctomycetes bacterium]|nr:amino acid permease [Planctomycetota bacterium]